MKTTTTTHIQHVRKTQRSETRPPSNTDARLKPHQQQGSSGGPSSEPCVFNGRRIGRLPANDGASACAAHPRRGRQHCRQPGSLAQQGGRCRGAQRSATRSYYKNTGYAGLRARSGATRAAAGPAGRLARPGPRTTGAGSAISHFPSHKQAAQHTPRADRAGPGEGDEQAKTRRTKNPRYPLSTVVGIHMTAGGLHQHAAAMHR
jgi:hypothetical protein